MPGEIEAVVSLWRSETGYQVRCNQSETGWKPERNSLHRRVPSEAARDGP